MISSYAGRTRGFVQILRMAEPVVDLQYDIMVMRYCDHVIIETVVLYGCDSDIVLSISYHLSVIMALA